MGGLHFSFHFRYYKIVRTEGMYRLLEILPGVLAWTTLFGVVIYFSIGYYFYEMHNSHLSKKVFYRMLEIIPGALAWLTLINVVLIAWRAPITASFFIIAFDLYWLLKTVFFSLHITASYRQMRENLKIDWMARLRQLTTHNPQLTTIKGWQDLYHLVILPAYREPYEVLKASLEAIKNSSWPQEQMIVVLGMEERGGEEDLEAARRIEEEYGAIFFKFLVTRHPVGLPGEIPGKGSNATWAAKESQKVIDELGIPYERIIVSSLDSDTQVYPEYFSLVTCRYLTEPDPLHASYQPIPVYHNNIWDAPAISRVVATSDTFWQMVQQSRPERLVSFSSHSMPFKSLVEVGFWHKDIVSEDSRIFWQCFLFYNGNWRAVPLYYPISMDANVAQTLLKTSFNIYRQHRRWTWGVENIPYLLYGFLQNKKISFRKKIFYTLDQVEGFWSLSTNAIVILLLGWLPPLIGKGEFSTSVLAHNLPFITQLLMTTAMIGLAFSAIISLYLLPTRPNKKPYYWKSWLLLEWLLIPITGTLFGAIPGLEAQTRLMLGNKLGFWRTPKIRK